MIEGGPDLREDFAKLVGVVGVDEVAGVLEPVGNGAAERAQELEDAASAALVLREVDANLGVELAQVARGKTLL